MKRALWGLVLGLACPAGMGGCAFLLGGSGDGEPSKYQGGVGVPKPVALPSQARPGPSPSAAPAEPFDPGKL